MPSIKILKIDETKSQPLADNPYYVLLLSGKPDQKWKNELDKVYQKSRNDQVMNLGVNQQKPDELTFTTPASADIDQIITYIQGLIKELDSEENQALGKIREINKKLAGDKPS